MNNNEQIAVRLPAREDSVIQFTLDKSVNNDTPYHVKHVRRLAWVLMQSLPMHVVEHLIHELMIAAQETILRGARIEAAQKGKRLFMSVHDSMDSPFPGGLQLWFDGEAPVGTADSVDGEEEFEVGGASIMEDEEYE